jgi:hypothetical protein
VNLFARLESSPDTVQLVLPDLTPAAPAQRWWLLPETTRREVVALLARLIARGVLIEPDRAADSRRTADE